jgi:hypothetical protein
MKAYEKASKGITSGNANDRKNTGDIKVFCHRHIDIKNVSFDYQYPCQHGDPESDGGIRQRLD